MLAKFKFFSVTIALLLLIGGCKKKEYNMGDLTAPSDIVITTSIVGQDATHPDGDGSGDLIISASAKNAIAFKIDFDQASGDPDKPLTAMKTATVTHKYPVQGVHTYRIAVVAYGSGGVSSVATKEVSVYFNYVPPEEVSTALVGTGSKTWVVDKDVAGHFGVGPWNDASVTPEWYAATPNEKAACCNCFYSATFTFKKTGDAYSLQVNSSGGAFTKTGALAGGLPGIPASGDEGCYASYAGGTSSFSFVPSSTGVDAGAPSTKVAILLGGNNTYIGYGAQLKEYEIMTISDDAMYLRVQGTETGNAWYLKLKPL